LSHLAFTIGYASFEVGLPAPIAIPKRGKLLIEITNHGPAKSIQVWLKRA
jgi:hypothetical protein